MSRHAPEPEARYRSDVERVERLLEDLRGSAGPATFRKIEELVHRLVGLYGEGLARVLKAGGEALASRLEGDELVESLMLVHGLHPRSPAERIRRALEQVRPYLGSHAGDVQMVELNPEGVVTLRLLGTCSGCPSSRATVEHTLKKAIEEAAPEVTRIEVEGIAPPVAGAGRGASVEPARQWRLLHPSELPAQGQFRGLDVLGTPVLIAGINGTWVAYRNGCPACGAALDGGKFTAPSLDCGGCGARYDLAHAGHRVGSKGEPLTPMPLLPSGKTARLEVPALEVAR